MAHNNDTYKEFNVGQELIRGIGSFHKTLPHNDFGEVCTQAFNKLVDACSGDGNGFAAVPKGTGDAATLTNPQAGLASDRLIHHPASYRMPPAPTVLSYTAAAEITELYWMALLRDVPFNKFVVDPDISVASDELDKLFRAATMQIDDHLILGVDVPGSSVDMSGIDPQNLFRLGLPGEEFGPLLSQFFVRPVPFGTQTINSMQRPYKSGKNYLTEFNDWLHAQRSGKDRNGQAYPNANEHDDSFFEKTDRYISTMRDLARFVNKDALHQAYFNAALLLLSGGAKWNSGNPYSDCGTLKSREAGFGVLGGPHILALVSEVATRALKVVWNQKWQINLRLRPEAYGGLVHVQNIGVNGITRPYMLPDWVSKTKAATQIYDTYGSYLLPMAFTPGSPTHPAYGAGHATVAGACVTVLKAFFKTFDTVDDNDVPIKFVTLTERCAPWGKGETIKAYVTGEHNGVWDRFDLSDELAATLTIEGELNKLAQNVAMGRSMGGVHWRTDNSRSLVLGESIAAEILAEITLDTNENEYFEFRSFSRANNGQPKKIRIQSGRIYVDGVLTDTHTSSL